MGRDQCVEVAKAVLATDLMQVEAVEHRPLDGGTDQAGILTVTSGRIRGAYVCIHVDDLERGVRIEQVTEIQQRDLANDRSLQPRYLRLRPGCLATLVFGHDIAVAGYE